jgi:hypothetical protein
VRREVFARRAARCKKNRHTRRSRLTLLWLIPSKLLLALVALFCLSACATTPDYDVVIRNGTILDGSGSPGYTGQVALKGDRIAAPGSTRLGNEASSSNQDL